MSSVPVSLNGLRIMPSSTRLQRASRWFLIFFCSEVEDSWCSKPSMVSDVEKHAFSNSSMALRTSGSRAQLFPFLLVDHRVIWLHYPLSGIWCCAHMALIKGHHRKLFVPTMNDDFPCMNSWWTEGWFSKSRTMSHSHKNIGSHLAYLVCPKAKNHGHCSLHVLTVSGQSPTRWPKTKRQHRSI